MAVPITLYREWKVPLSQSKYTPVAMQVSLYDLMLYRNKANRLCSRFHQAAKRSNFKSMGLELQHNIIVFDSNIYQIDNDPEIIKNGRGHRIINQNDEKNETDNWGTSFEEFARSGFDICLPKFDKRTKPLFLNWPQAEKLIPDVTPSDYIEVLRWLQPKRLRPDDFYYNLSIEDNLPYSNGIKIWDKDAALKPLTSFDCYDNSVMAFSRGDANTWDDYPNPFTVGLENDYAYLRDPNDPESATNEVQYADIILSNRDHSFEDRFIVKDSGYMAYNGLCVNPKSVNIWANLYKYYNSSFDPIRGTENNFADHVATLINIDTEDCSVSHINPVTLYLLQHCYVWVKCSFFADYIDYRDFDQSLNKTAKVIHNNMMLTNVGDYRRYEELFHENHVPNKDRARASRPYLPMTTPSVDLLRTTLLPSEITVKPNYDNGSMDEIINAADDPASKIGALPIDPLERAIEDEADTYTSLAFNTPPQVWFDPESRKTGADYKDYPILFPKDGNLHMNGRIISPTIDELWKMIKELIAGRRPDGELIGDEAGLPRGEDRTIGNRADNRFNRIDTRPTIRNHGFKDHADPLKREVIGDPTFIDYELDDDDEPYYDIKHWVNDPSKIQYQVIKEFVSLNTILCNGGPIATVFESIEAMPAPEQYLPSMTTPSIRELEAQLKGLRWNLVYYMTMMHNNVAYNGLLGRPNSDDQIYNEAGGSTYMLHKDYSAKDSYRDVPSPNQTTFPNTVYDERFNRNVLPIPEYGVGLGPMAKDGEDITTTNKDVVPSWATYMGADGQWHSSKQALLIPIRTISTTNTNDEYF